MKLLNHLKLYKYPIIFLIFVIFYFLYYGPFGYDDADGGCTLALSWRIFNGEIPYKDFISVRPPFSPIFHALPMFIIPANYQIIFDRLFVYFLFALSSLFGALALTKVFRLSEFNLNPYLLATIGFVFSVHNFPPMAWHTVDGVFFASIGIYILASFSSSFSVAFGLLFLFLSALCKQPFYLIPFAGVIYVFLIHENWKKTTISILSLLFYIGVFLLILFKHGAFTSFITLTSGSTKLGDLYLAGYINYISVESIYLILPFALWIILRKFSDFKVLPNKVDLVPYFFISILLIRPMVYFIHFVFYKEVIDTTLLPAGDAPAFFRDSAAKFLFLVTIFFLLINLSLEKKWITLWFLTIVSWCASISWGYQTPVLFSVPLIFGFLLVSHQYFKVKKITNLAMYTLFLGSIIYFIAYQRPYCNPIRHELTYRVDDLFPKLKFIKVSRETHDKYTEFAFLVSKYGRNFKTLPGMPLSNYLTNTNSPIKIDWVFNAETNKNNDLIIKDLYCKKTIIFMEKKSLMIKVSSDSKEKYNSSVAYFIKNNWQKVDNTVYFEIFKIK